MPTEEPSVLDVVKSRLKFWDRGPKVEIPPLPDAPVKGRKKAAPARARSAGPKGEASQAVQPAKPVRAVKTAAARKRAVPVEEQPAVEAPHPGLSVPWRSLLALVVALSAQTSFELRNYHFAIFLYVLAGLLLAWGMLRKEWALAALPPTEPRQEALTYRRWPLLLSVILGLLAFITLGKPVVDNLFTPLNVTLWLLAIACFAWAFWLPEPKPVGLWDRLKEFFGRRSWRLTITRWSLLVLAVTAVVVFYRVYRINSVPLEPFSDHAEKLLDVYDVTQGQTHIFFPRNTGREAIQFYLTVVLNWLLGTGLSFLTLKLDTILCGLLTLPYMYLLGKEFGGKRVGLLAVFFTGIGYWPNVISRVGLRFPLYPLFVAPTLYYLLRGLRTRRRNDFIISGLFLGFGLHGYSPFRIVPLVVVIAVGLYLLHRQSQGYRKQSILWLIVLALTSFFVFLPLAHYWLDYPDIFGQRAFSRLGTPSNPIPGVWWQVLLSNTWNALKMFNWDNGSIWVHSVPYRPALDVVSGALFLIGAVLLLVRYVRQRHWQDLFLLLAVPLLQLPSILSLAFPAENPALNRAAGALVPTFLIVAVALDGLLANLEASWSRKGGKALMWIVVLALAVTSALQNYDLVFNQYREEFDKGSWNSSELGQVIKLFGETYGTTDNAWIVPYAYWVDTRLPGVWAGIPNRDFALWPQDFASTQSVSGTKLIILNIADTADVTTLEAMYPQGVLSTYPSATKIPGKNFLIFFIPPAK